MSNPPNWLMWLTVIIVAVYILDIVLKVIVWTVTEVAFYFENKRRTNYFEKKKHE